MKKHPRLGSRFWTILLIDRTAIQRVGLDSVNATDGLGLYRVSALPLGENGWCQMFQPCMLLCNCRRIQLNIIYFVSYVARHVCINTIEQRRDKKQHNTLKPSPSMFCQNQTSTVADLFSHPSTSKDWTPSGSPKPSNVPAPWNMLGRCWFDMFW